MSLCGVVKYNNTQRNVNLPARPAALLASLLGAFSLNTETAQMLAAAPYYAAALQSPHGWHSAMHRCNPGNAISVIPMISMYAEPRRLS